MGYLIDSSVLIAWEREPREQSRLDALADGERLAVSAVTASELLHGVERSEGAQRRARRSAFVEAVLSTLEVLPFDLDVSRVHARLWADLRAQGQAIGDHDMMIAATALTHGLVIATRNARHFARIAELSVETW